jgi:hypothetical protein
MTTLIGDYVHPAFESVIHKDRTRSLRTALHVISNRA